MGDLSVIGRVGSLVIGTRGPDGAGEVQVRVRGGVETYLAWSDDPLPTGGTVLVVESLGPRTVHVVAWTDFIGAFDGR